MGTGFSAPKISVYSENVNAHRKLKHGRESPFVLVTYLPKADNIQLKYDKRLGVYTNDKEKLDKIQATPLPPIRLPHYRITKVADVRSIVENLQFRPETTVEDLVHQLLLRGKDKIKPSGDTEDELTDADIVRLLYFWLTSQDVRKSEFCLTVNTFSIDYQRRDLSQKKNSYAAFFSLMCSYAGIPCVIVNGCVKGGKYYPGYKNLWSKLVREWNAVLVDGQWRLVDVLWGTSAEATKAGHIKSCTDAWYMFPKPEELIYTHYPFNEKWQLLQQPLKRQDFEEQAFLNRRFFELGMQLTYNSHKRGVFVSKTGEVDIRFDNSSSDNQFENVVTRFNPAKNAWQKMDIATVDLKRITDKPFHVDAKFYQKGSYKLEIVGKKTTNTNSNMVDYDWVAIYQVIIETPVDIGWGATEYMTRFGLKSLSHQMVTVSCEPNEETVFEFKIIPNMLEAMSLSYLVVDSENQVITQVGKQKQPPFLPNPDGTVQIPVTVDAEGEFKLKISACVNGVESGEVVKYKMISNEDDVVEKVNEALILLRKSIESRKRIELRTAVQHCESLGVAGHSKVVEKYKIARDILKIPEITRNVIHNVKLLYFIENPTADVASVVKATLILLGFNRPDLVSQHDFVRLIKKFENFNPDSVTNEMCIGAEKELGTHGDLERVVRQNKDLAAFGSWLLGVFDVKGYVRQIF